jgi:hypothetical protein
VLKRRILVILMTLTALFVVFALVLRPAPEPEYEGKKLSEWVIKLVLKPTGGAERTAATEAISERGTNTLPYLIGWVGYETPPWQRLASSAATRTFRDSRWQFIDRTNVVRGIGAAYAFRALGPKAAPGIGNLSRIASDPKRSHSRICAIQALGDIGVAALPAIVGILTNEQSRTAKSSLVRIGCDDCFPSCGRGSDRGSTRRARFVEYAR